MKSPGDTPGKSLHKIKLFFLAILVQSVYDVHTILKEVTNMNKIHPDIDDMIFAEEEIRISDR